MTAQTVKPVSIQELYKKIPKVECKHCGECCGQIEMSPAEKQSITEYCQRNNIPLGNLFAPFTSRFTEAILGHWQCCMYKDGKCQIYEVRPLICRLQGTVPGLPCPNYPDRKYPLTDDYSGRLIQRSWRANF